jgi:tRNA-2-methylthio-N6-dimethylallyladenosine synthase
MKFFIRTYGCQMNERDSEAIAAKLVAAGHEPVCDEKLANVVILNTCSVREQAELKAIGKSGYLARRKRTDSNFKIGIVGCMAENLGAELFEKNSAIDFVVGPNRLAEIADLICQSGQHLRVGDVPVKNGDGYDHSQRGTGDGEEKNYAADEKFDRENFAVWQVKNYSTAGDFDRLQSCGKCSTFLSIMQGCNMRCSYCVVPKTRGRERYRPMDDIVAEASFLAKNGTKEITLLGQIVNNYGGGQAVGSGGRSPFVKLLERLDGISGLERIRYMSPHPTYFSDCLIRAHGSLPKLCPSVHLPIQSGSERILKSMGRPYGRSQILEIMAKLREISMDMSISTDIIVGYPGESSVDFGDTISLFDAAAFDMAFIFKYSERAGTKSAELSDNVPEDEKERRNQVMLRRVEELSLSNNRKLHGKIVQILVEGRAKRGNGIMFGRTPNHRKVLFHGTENQIGQILGVKISDSTMAALFGSTT